MFNIELSEDEGWYLFKAIKHDSSQLERLINRIRSSERGRLDGRLSVDVSNEFHAATGVLGLLEQGLNAKRNKPQTLLEVFSELDETFPSNPWLASRAEDIKASPYHKLPVTKEDAE